LIFCDADKVANCRIICRGLAQCSPGQFGGHAGLQKPPDVRIGGDRFNRWQACQVKGPIGRRFGPGLRGRSFSAGRKLFLPSLAENFRKSQFYACYLNRVSTAPSAR